MYTLEDIQAVDMEVAQAITDELDSAILICDVPQWRMAYIASLRHRVFRRS